MANYAVVVTVDGEVFEQVMSGSRQGCLAFMRVMIHSYNVLGQDLDLMYLPTGRLLSYVL